MKSVSASIEGLQRGIYNGMHRAGASRTTVMKEEES